MFGSTFNSVWLFVGYLALLAIVECVIWLLTRDWGKKSEDE